MTRTRLLMTVAVAATMLVGSLASAASRMNEDQIEAQGLAQAGISLVQAIQAAEQRVGAKAVSARLGHRRGSYVYEVEVLQGENATDVKVDSTDGKVLSEKPDEDKQERK